MLFQLFLSIFAVYAVLYDVRGGTQKLPQKKALRGCWQIRKVHLQSLP
jgi:hypothetical protein